MSILALTSDTLIGTAAAGNIEYNGQFFGTDSNNSRAQMQRIVLETAQATTSGTSKDFTGIPAWVKRVTVLMSGVSLSASANPLIQLGTSGGIQATSYVGTLWTANTTNTALSTGFLLLSAAGAGVTIEAGVTISLLNPATGLWVASGTIGRSDAGTAAVLAGSKTLSGTLDRVRITSTSTDTFDAGSVNIIYEG